MPIIKNFTAPNGATLQFHKIGAIEVRDGTLIVNVQSWPTEAAYLGGAAPAWNTPLSGATPAGFIDQVMSAVLASAQFSGGAQTSDAAQTLGAVKVRRWAALKAERQAREFGTFAWNGASYDCDAQSQVRIIGAAQLAALALAAQQAFEIEWTRADDSVATLSAADMIAMGQALATHVQAAHQTGRAVHQQIQAAATAEEVAAVAWPE